MHAWGQAHLFTEDQYWQVVIYTNAGTRWIYRRSATLSLQPSALRHLPSRPPSFLPPYLPPGPTRTTRLLGLVTFPPSNRPALGINSARDYRQLTYTRLKYVIKEEEKAGRLQRP